MLTRQREFLQWIIGGISTSALIVGGVWVSDHPATALEAIRDAISGSSMIGSTSSASVASEGPAKIEILQKHVGDETTPSQKASGNMLLSLSSAEGRRSDGSLTLDAKITATLDLNDLKYEWVLPDSVTLSTGAIRGDLGSLAEGASTSLEVTLNVPPQADERVHLHVYREIAGEKLGQVAQYKTLSQPMINAALMVTREAQKAESNRKPASSNEPHDTRRME